VNKQSAVSFNDMKQVRCVLFDLDGTLYYSWEYSQRVEEEIVNFVAAEISMPYGDARLLLDERRKTLGTLTSSLESLGIDRAKFFDSMAARIEPSEYLLEDPAVRAAIAKLKQHGFRVGLVSNSGKPLVDKILRALHLDSSIFDVIVTSSDARPKPYPDPFLLSLDLLKCARKSAIYVGDRDEAELRPAKELGIRTILMDRSGKSSKQWADVAVRKISEIPDIAMKMLSKP